ncbi:MAG: ribose-5-phosphate isomerase RpiA [Candidatus Odinarchaeia archaeon]
MENSLEYAKKNAAFKALKEIKDGQVIGIGSGSTVSYLIKFLGEKIKSRELDILAVPSSYQSFYELVNAGVKVTSLDEHPQLDITIDGADEVDGNFNMIKGGGAALTREKIIASVAKKVVIIVDYTKITEKLGSKPVPVEVIPFAFKPVYLTLQKMGGKPVLRMGKHKMGPVITDNGNLIIDVKFSEITDPENFEWKINNIPGVVENGIFYNLVDALYVGYEDKVEILTPSKS